MRPKIDFILSTINIVAIIGFGFLLNIILPFEIYAILNAVLIILFLYITYFILIHLTPYLLFTLKDERLLKLTKYPSSRVNEGYIYSLRVNNIEQQLLKRHFKEVNGHFSKEIKCSYLDYYTYLPIARRTNLLVFIDEIIYGPEKMEADSLTKTCLITSNPDIINQDNFDIIIFVKGSRVIEIKYSAYEICTTNAKIIPKIYTRHKLKVGLFSNDFAIVDEIRKIFV